MVERCLAKADIAGSNPVSRSTPRAFARGFLFLRDVEPAGFQLRGQGVRIPSPAPKNTAEMVTFLQYFFIQVADLVYH